MKNKLQFMGIALATMLILSSCGNAKKEEKVTINILWQQEVSETFWELPIEKFTANHPDVEIDFQSNPKAVEAIKNNIAAKTPPDIFFTWISDVDYYGMINEDVLRPVDAMLKADNAEKTGTLTDTVFSAGVALGAYNDQHYFLPVSKFLASNFYDATYFTEKGYSAPVDWNAFLALSDQIKADGEATPLIYAGAYPFMLMDALILPMIYNIDPSAVDAINNNDGGAWELPAVKTAMARVQTLIDKGFVDKNSLAMDHVQSQIDFIGHKALFVPSGGWLEGEMEGQWPEGFALTPMFAPSENGSTSTTTVVECMVFPKQPDNTKEVYITELIQSFYSDENVEKVVKETGFLLATNHDSDAVLSSLPNSTQQIWKMSADNVALLSPTYKIKYKSLITEMNNNINAMVQGEIDSEAFCAKMNAKAQELE